LLKRWLSRTRSYGYRGIRLQIPPEVFHPGFFFSTRLLLKFLRSHPAGGCSILELGAGSGLISLVAARDGARVSATDINPVAVKWLQKNSEDNGINLTIILSDLFDHLPVQQFDRIVINPPYYRGAPSNYSEYAWYCGENGEYFSGLFSGLGPYMHHRTEAWMILSDGSDLEMIRNIACRNGWRLHCIYEKANLIEKNFIFKVVPASL
jgi:release factor glutamine methyltransferase